MSLQATVRRVLKAAPFALPDVAADAGLSYHTIRAYAYGKRTPEPENVAKLVRALRRRAEKILDLADRLEREAGG
ncbi:MAG TPA: hypothetical protein VIL18_06935 [Longimicrobiales bacterium]